MATQTADDRTAALRPTELQDLTGAAQTSGRAAGALMFDFFAMAIAVVALIVARKTFNQAAILRARLDAMEATGFQARPAPPPLTARVKPDPAPTAPSPDIVPAQPATVASKQTEF